MRLPARLGDNAGRCTKTRLMSRQPSAPDSDSLPQPTSDPPAATATLPAPKRQRRPLWARFFGWLARPWLRLSIEQPPPLKTCADAGQRLVYVLEDYGLSNALILDRACRDSGLPCPLLPLTDHAHDNLLKRQRAYVALSRRSSNAILLPEQRPVRSHSQSLANLLQAHREDASLDVQLVPVSIFIGRAPDRHSGWFAVLFSENWTLVGRFRRLLALLFNGRNSIVRFAAPLSLRRTVDEGLNAERTVRKLQRVLRTHFRRIRQSVIGPDLSTRRLLINRVLAAESVRAAIAAQARRDNIKPEQAWKKAHRYAWEIAADYSSPVVRSASFVLSYLWDRIFAGVRTHHLEKFKQIAPGHEIIYVPSHRSHMDYLLLSYLLYGNGIVPPHIVAGINLNLPLVGSLLRRGGAFFIRRSIKGNVLYSAVLSEYVALLVADGYSIEYFIDGGRSRTGRLLQPKGGMIAMTVRAFLRQPRRPVLFQPVYIGYEKLMEGSSHLDELYGRPKRKESIWVLLWNIPKILRQNYGQVVVNFGQPIALDTVLAKHAPNWDGQPLADDEKPVWLSGTVDTLAEQIQTHINAAADVNPINLLALALLSTPKHAMAETDLIAQIELCKRLLTDIPYSDHADRITVTPHSPQHIIEHAEAIKLVTRIRHPLGDVLQVDTDTAVLLSYFRNNVLHLFTTASWVACCFQHNRRMSHSSVLRLGRALYPFLKAELFLPWDESTFSARIDQTIEVFIRVGLLDYASDSEDGTLERRTSQSDEVFRLRALGHSLQQAFERYYITISVLVKNGSGTLGAGQLENLCQQAAQRLSLLYAPAAPEFFDRALFRSFIRKLRELRLVWPDEHSHLVFDEQLAAWARDARYILGRELRHSIERVSPEIAREPVLE